MVDLSLSNKRYTYVRESESEPTRGAIDVHHVIINGSGATGYARRKGIGFFLVLLASSMYFLLGKVMIFCAVCYLDMNLLEM